MQALEVAFEEIEVDGKADIKVAEAMGKSDRTIHNNYVKESTIFTTQDSYIVEVY